MSWKKIFTNQIMSIKLMRSIFKENTDKQKVLTRSDAVAICKLAIIETYENMIEKTDSNIIKRELEKFKEEDISALGL